MSPSLLGTDPSVYSEPEEPSITSPSSLNEYLSKSKRLLELLDGAPLERLAAEGIEEANSIFKYLDTGSVYYAIDRIANTNVTDEQSAQDLVSLYKLIEMAFVVLGHFMVANPDVEQELAGLDAIMGAEVGELITFINAKIEYYSRNDMRKVLRSLVRIKSKLEAINQSGE